MNSKMPLCLLEIKSLCTSPLPLDMQTKKIYQIGGNPIYVPLCQGLFANKVTEIAKSFKTLLQLECFYLV